MKLQSKSLAQSASTDTIFGHIRYLESVTIKLYQNEICSGRDLEKLTEDEFFEMLGRIQPNVRNRIMGRISEMGLHFHP
jgi:hypothetical protein